MLPKKRSLDLVSPHPIPVHFNANSLLRGILTGATHNACFSSFFNRTQRLRLSHVIITKPNTSYSDLMQV